MIGYLRGAALDSETVLAGDVGYHVQTAAGLPAGEPVELWIRTVVRESDIALYGFGTKSGRDLFDALVKVTGVGPRMALGVLTLGTGEVARALAAKDAAALAKAPGIGVKKASQIVASVVVPPSAAEDLDPAPAGPAEAVTSALVGLGSSRDEATRVVDGLTRGGWDGTEEALLRLSLLELHS